MTVVYFLVRALIKVAFALDSPGAYMTGNLVFTNNR